MHLATALGKPMVALYGPTSPQRTGPFGRADAVVRLDLSCSPCYLKRVADCPHSHRCLRELSSDMVFERLCRILPPEIAPALRGGKVNEQAADFQLSTSGARA